jgi:hypothetical protein
LEGLLGVADDAVAKERSGQGCLQMHTTIPTYPRSDPRHVDQPNMANSFAKAPHSPLPHHNDRKSEHGNLLHYRTEQLRAEAPTLKTQVGRQIFINDGINGFFLQINDPEHQCIKEVEESKAAEQAEEGKVTTIMVR